MRVVDLIICATSDLDALLGAESDETTPAHWTARQKGTTQFRSHGRAKEHGEPTPAMRQQLELPGDPLTDRPGATG